MVPRSHVQKSGYNQRLVCIYHNDAVRMTRNILNTLGLF